uniref:flagellar export protein FliJ n=1 Tax=Methylibium sp. TaxID=2067992 RepID=UPI003341C569
QRLLAEREARLTELARYRADYERGPMEGSPRLLINHRLFLDRLRDAERFQRQLVEQSQLEIANERARWLARHREVKTLDQLADLYRQRERAQEERATQKRLDEFALRLTPLQAVGDSGW